MSNAIEEIGTIVPTLVIGVGGTGLEVIARLRRLVTESYGSLDKLPIVGFLHIDTAQDYKLSNPAVAGPPLQASEKFWSQVTLQDAEKIAASPDGYSWFHAWLPPELISVPKKLSSEEGAGQIRACGRFSFFFNRGKIREKCEEARTRIQGHEQTMIKDYNLTVQPKLNIFVIGSISGGTGSGMLIDLGYSLRQWFKGEYILETTAIIPSPDAFAGISGDARIQENGYAALMELNYFSDENTKYSVLYGPTENSRLEHSSPPYDYIYIVGTQNELGTTLKADTVREMMAQNIFLDLVSDYSSYKRVIRDNIRSLAGGNDNPINNSLGRSYPRNFLSFGIASIEIPIHPIRNYLSALLAADLYKWWLNSEVLLPSDIQSDIEKELKGMKLLGKELRGGILLAPEGPYQQVIQQWLKSVSEEIVNENRLQCTSQLPNIPPFANETGKILEFIDGYLQPKVDQYRLDHLRDDQLKKGDFIQRMYENGNKLVNSAAVTLQEKLYSYLVVRNQGPKFLKVMLEITERTFNTQIEQLEREAEKTWEVAEKVGLNEYVKALSEINEFRTRWSNTKQNDMNNRCDKAFQGLGKSLQAGLERKSRLIAADVLRRLLVSLSEFKSRLNRWIMRIEQSEAKFREQAKQEANQVESLEFVGLKLFQPQELNELYADFLAIKGGRDVLFQQMTEEVLERSHQSKFWNQSPYAATKFRLLDVEKIAEVEYSGFEEVVDKITRRFIKEAPPQSKLYSNMDACTRFMRLYPQEQEQQTQIQFLFNQSKPLVRLDQNIPLGRFNYISIPKAGIIGGENTTEIAAQQQVKILKKYFTKVGAIGPLTERERHKILAVQEVGGFSLRCIYGTDILRSSYQKWWGERIKAERAMLGGQEKVEMPIPVHLQKDMVFWDFMPSDPAVKKLVLIARAFGILRQETNQKIKKDVIRYRKKSELGEDTVTVAATWEEAVQILELPDCRDDRREVQKQLDEMLEQAETDLQKQELRGRLETFLTERLRSEFRKIGEDDPRYLQEKTIIQEFIADNKLGAKINSDDSNTLSPSSNLGFTIPPEDSSTKTPKNSGESISESSLRPKFCSQCGSSLIESHRFCQRCGHSVGNQ